ncbi:MAG: UDP-N-acetylmuramate dehydrogenase [Synergistaceae bacterium]|nr:UDP-N-acetylmuramate dehydrogenase [Synergistaceae bacterium]
MPLNNTYSAKFTENVSLSPLTTLGAGGVAEVFASPSNAEELCGIIRSLKECPVYVIGGGSNILIPDGRIPGLVISSRKLTKIKWLNDYSAEIGAGYPLPLLVKNLRERNIGGLEFAVGIPGTLGGAVSGNAGAGGKGVCMFVDSVKAVDSSGDMITLKRGEFEYGYRKCDISGAIITSVAMSFPVGASWNEDEASNFAAKRKSQPLDSRNAGCTFKNPEGHSAGKLLDDCGCKGMFCGEAVVSDKHANFIINRGSASSSDIEELIELCAERVFERTGIRLEREIKPFMPCFSVK